MRRHPPARLLRDRRGGAAVEFAILMPVFLLLMCGMFDLSHQLYMRGVLQGSVQKAARDSTLESGADTARQDALDAKVRSAVRNISNRATVAITRRFYRTFAAAAARQAEPFPGANDTNHNGKCDNNEVFVDTNRNGVRDMDGGDSGQGGAKDRTVYTVAIDVPRLFPIWRFIGGSDRFKVSATTVLANQPFTDQGRYDPAIEGHCNP